MWPSSLLNSQPPDCGRGKNPIHIHSFPFRAVIKNPPPPPVSQSVSQLHLVFDKEQHKSSLLQATLELLRSQIPQIRHRFWLVWWEKQLLVKRGLFCAGNQGTGRGNQTSGSSDWFRFESQLEQGSEESEELKMVAAVAAGRGWPYFDPEYDTLTARINPPRVVIDNQACDYATIIKLDSMNRNGILLDVVQALSDLELSILKAYIISDGGWFMDVFHVTDREGKKLADPSLLEQIEHNLGEKGVCRAGGCRRSIGVQSLADYTAIELTGSDRPGLLSEISAVLTNLGCNVVAAEVWTHNTRVACMVYVTDLESEGGCGPVELPEKLCRIKEMLGQVMKGDSVDERAAARTDFSIGPIATHTERRLHQMMSDDKDYERVFSSDEDEEDDLKRGSDPSLTSVSESVDCKGRPTVTVRNCVEKGYSMVTVQCKDRPKLLFDTVCTLTDMQYVVFHATIDSEGPFAFQEYYIRHLDGCTLNSESERQRVIRGLEAAILRRASQGVRLELCTQDRIGLLSDVTRIFCEKGLSVARAEVTTREDMAVNVFYVTDSAGKDVDMKVVEAIREQVGLAILKVKQESSFHHQKNKLLTASSSPDANSNSGSNTARFSLGTFFRSHSERLLYNLGLLKSFS